MDFNSSINRTFIILCLIFLAPLAYSQLPEPITESGSQIFRCPPCGCNMDEHAFNEPGECSSCGMNLIGEENPNEGYAYTNIYPIDVCNLVQGSEADDWVFLDVRRRDEYMGNLGHLNNAIHINVEELGSRLDELEPYKNKKILVYCLMSIRSMRASQMLIDNGFKNVTNMLGGMRMWDRSDTDELPCKENARTIE